MSTANSLFEIFQLSDQIPVTDTLQRRRIRCLYAAPIRTVTRTGYITLLTVMRILFTVAGAGLSGSVLI